MKNPSLLSALLSLLLAVGGIIGCATPRAAVPPPPAADPDLAAVEALLTENQYAEAVARCIELSRRDPLRPGLAELQQRIMQALAARRATVAELRQSTTDSRMGTDAEKHKALPDTFETRLPVQGQSGPLRTARTAMEELLRRPVSIHLENATLPDFVLALGAAGVNMVADDLSNANRTFTIHADQVPLAEILDYASRNLGIAFHAGENLIWATPLGAGEMAVPMETRLYRLRKGLANKDLSAEDQGLALIEAIKRFVPQENGADLFFDRNAHVLIAKNTRENLAKVEDIIEALDVVPPQVLIEARFITVGVDDLLELGIDWTLNSPYRVTSERGMKNGRPITATESQIDKGATVSGTEFVGAASGLNLTFRGVLTDPMFQAVLHALETSGKSRTLSVPKVATVNNRTATIRIGEDFRYFDEYDIQSTPSALQSGGATTYTTVLVPVGKPQLEELGILLEVTPSVGAELRDIMLRVVPEISDFVRYEYYQTGADNNDAGSVTNATLSVVKLPIFRRSRIETEVVVQSGETVVMGGLISSQESKVQEGVPVLSWLPLIGRLFRHDTVQEKKSNLLIFVTATLLSNRGENLIALEPAAAPAPSAAADATPAAAPAESAAVPTPAAGGPAAP